MELIRGLHNLRPAHRGCVATIGNFDGLHLGHRAVVDQVLALARARDCPAVVTIFEPQPREFFQPQEAPARLTRLREKCEILAGWGVDRVLCTRFDTALAAHEPLEFVERLLVQGLGVRALVVGDDFRFGRRRAGTVGLLREIGPPRGFDVLHAETFAVGGARVSSTRVREALARGDFAEVRRLLGREFSLSGRVGHGEKRGRTIGYPTANLDLHRRAVPLAGIFAVRVHGLGPRPVDGVAYVGTRPIVNGVKPLLEVHLFDWVGDCYGRHLRVDVLAKVRDEMTFTSFDEMRVQIDRDSERARGLLADCA